MATVQQVLASRLATFQVALTDVDMSALLIDYSLDGGVTYSKTNATLVKQAIVAKLAELLAKPDITEGGMSLKWDRSAVQAYVSAQQTELGQSTGQAIIKDRSSLW